MNYSKNKDRFFKLYSDVKSLSDIKPENLIEMVKNKFKILTSLKHQGYEFLIEDFKEFSKNHTLCKNCNELFEGKNYLKCPNEKCADYIKNEKNKITQKRQQTTLKKYGTQNVSQSQIIKDKKTDTFMKNYGVSNGFKSGEIKEKIKLTNKERWGAENPAHSKILKQKRDLTNLKKYGSTSPFGSKEVQLKSKETLFSNYGVSNPLKSKEIQLKIKQTNLERYGCENPNQNAEIKEKSKQTNLKKYGTLYPNQTHIKNYGDYNNPAVWQQFKTSVEAQEYFGISDVHSRFKLYEFNPSAVKDRSSHQKFLFDSIKTQNKIQNSKSVIPPKEIDIYLPDAKLGIEYNGLMYHSQGISSFEPFNTPDFDSRYHLNKTLECKSKGIRLFHIFEGEDLDLWLSMIHSKLGINTRVYARKCSVRIIDSKETRDFLNENHIQGYIPAKICLGLYYLFTEGEKLVSLMTFSKPRFSKKYEYEMIRFCSLKHHNVVGGASKLWKFFLEKYNPKSVVSYANLRFSSGELYEKLGFTRISQSAPNYFYFKSLKLESRNKYQKHKLEKLYDAGVLNYFNPSETEVQNMFKNGYRRIFDAGNSVYSYTIE